MYLFLMTVRLSNQETPCTNQANNNQFKVKSCYVLLCKLLLCIRSYLKSVLKYKFLIWISTIRTLYLYQQGGEDSWLLQAAKSRPRAKPFRETLFQYVPHLSRRHLDEVGRVAQSIQRLPTGWTVQGSNPGGGEIFRTCPDQP